MGTGGAPNTLVGVQLRWKQKEEDDAIMYRAIGGVTLAWWPIGTVGVGERGGAGEALGRLTASKP